MFSANINATEIIQLTGRMDPYLYNEIQNTQEHCIDKNKASYVSFRKKNEHLCGGTLITSRFILTVITCVYLFEDKSQIKAAVGVGVLCPEHISYHDIEQILFVDKEGPLRFVTVSIIPHKYFEAFILEQLTKSIYVSVGAKYFLNRTYT